MTGVEHPRREGRSRRAGEYERSCRNCKCDELLHRHYPFRSSLGACPDDRGRTRPSHTSYGGLTYCCQVGVAETRTDAACVIGIWAKPPFDSLKTTRVPGGRVP